MTLFMETTEIPAEKTAAEIEAVLIKNNAQAILKDYEGGELAAVSFKFRVNGNDVPFRLPCRWPAIAEILRRRAKISDFSWKYTGEYDVRRRRTIEAKAKKVAWRQILRWVQAQLALVETNMVTVQEVFTPYMQIGAQGETVYQMIEARHPLMIENFKS